MVLPIAVFMQMFCVVVNAFSWLIHSLTRTTENGEEEYLISSFEIGLARGGLKVALFWLAVFLALALVVCER